MKIIFGIQTEGNGHSIQAIAIKQYLRSKGETVNLTLAAEKEGGRNEFLEKEFDVFYYKGFDFEFDSMGRVVIWKTIIKNLIKLPKLACSMIQICKKIKAEKPEIIVNFYEPLVGLSALFFPKIKYISFGHQYAMESKFYPKITGFHIQKLFLKVINKITSIKSKKIALSYYEFKDENMIICPPILREESYTLKRENSDFILIYLMNCDRIPELILESKGSPNLKIECFSKFPNENKFQELAGLCPENLKIHKLCGKTFQEKMRTCKAVICSGGFETSSEAIYQFKPLLMIPTPNHFEQYANCNDASLKCFANVAERINLNKIPGSQIGNIIWFDKKIEKLEEIFCQQKSN